MRTVRLVPRQHLKALSGGLLLAFAGLLMGCHSGPGTVTLSGGGSTFVYPLMGHWAEEFQSRHPDILINYQSIGSGGGIQQVKAGTVDFGASDTSLTDEELAGMRPVLQFPEASGAVAITYNLPGLSGPLQLSGDTLARIYLGQIDHWRDPAVLHDNPGLNLPSKEIIVTHRADGSGTTGAFTAYLSSVSSNWATKVGSGKAVSWPVGLGGKGSEGVTGEVKESPGAIGYVELSFAIENKLPVASIKNQAGKFVAPSVHGTALAVHAFAVPLARDPRLPVVNPPASAAEAYPISTLTFVIVPRDGKDPRKRAALKEFLTYIVTDGQREAEKLHYTPLPDEMRRQDLLLLSEMMAAGQPLP